MKKYEYRYADYVNGYVGSIFYHNLQKLLDEYGEDGWEIVIFTRRRDSDFPSAAYEIVFRREKPIVVFEDVPKHELSDEWRREDPSAPCSFNDIRMPAKSTDMRVLIDAAKLFGYRLIRTAPINYKPGQVTVYFRKES